MTHPGGSADRCMNAIRGALFRDGQQHARQLIADYVLEDCTFDGWAGLMPDWSKPDPSLRPTLRNITLRNTNAYSAFLEGAIVEDVTVDRTKAGKSPLFLRGNVYRHVTLTGRISPLEIRGKMMPMYLPKSGPRVIAEWDRVNAEYYRTVDWALDITDATYGSLTITGVPTRLIRRNQENTAVVTRERAAEGKWRDIKWHYGVFDVVISMLLDDGYDDVLLIACPKSRRYDDSLRDLDALREAGIAV